jgi:hypothetical protein
VIPTHEVLKLEKPVKPVRVVIQGEKSEASKILGAALRAPKNMLMVSIKFAELPVRVRISRIAVQAVIN